MYGSEAMRMVEIMIGRAIILDRLPAYRRFHAEFKTMDKPDRFSKPVRFRQAG